MAQRPHESGTHIEYPSSDGEPVAETDVHRIEMIDYVVQVLEDWFESDPQVYVSGNNFIYYTEGEPRDCISPDAYVVRGVPKHLRDTFKVWEEGGHRPCIAFEITSKKTHRQDRGDKRAIYADELEVPELVLFDPRAEWIPERLRVLELRGRDYVHVIAHDDRVHSTQLGLSMGIVDGHLRFFDERGQMLRTRSERAAEESARADTEQARADAEKARADALAAELAQLRGQSPDKQ